MAERVGRFEIRSELGRGSQSVVYLAYDPRLDREVALKTLHLAGNTPGQNDALLAEARIVSRLRHPGIVPIFEAGQERGDLYLVFELVEGENLRAYARRRGPLPPEEAARLMIGILEAVQAAHAQDVIHRDLKPTNILIDGRGAPRVMDFGIACRAVEGAAAGSGLSGTPAYMAPEYINRREIGPGADVFAAGLILMELLTGRRVFDGRDPEEVMRRIAAEPARLPEGVEVDERLGGIALSAAAFDPRQRYQGPADLLRALHAWLAPTGDESASAAPSGGTLEFLLRRMRHKSDFPALSESVSAINRIASSEFENVDRLSSLVLRDFALTNKLLRVVNSSRFRRAGAGNISTVSRAVVVLGFDAVRNIAITVLLFEHLQDKAHAGELKEEFLLANLAGALARELSRHQGGREHEQVYVCALFHHLGRLLAHFYFPEECGELRKEMGRTGCSEEAAAMRVLGTSFAELGAGVARAWGFPRLILDSMERLPAGPVRTPDTPGERLRGLAGFASDLAATIASASPDECSVALERVAARYEKVLSLAGGELKGLIESAFREVADFARVIRVNLAQTRIGQKLGVLAGSGQLGEEAREDASGEGMGATVLETGPSPALATDNFGEEGGTKAADAPAVLAAGIQDISNTMVGDFKLNDVLRIILETMYRGMGFRRVLLCIRDPRNQVMQGRFGFGPEAAELARRFRFSLDFAPDVFHAATKNGVDILISDVDDAKVSPRIPEWFRAATTAGTFVVFPLNIKQKPVALIYAEKERAGEIDISDEELALLRTLRNQALLAIKQAG